MRGPLSFLTDNMYVSIMGGVNKRVRAYAISIPYFERCITNNGNIILETTGFKHVLYIATISF
jgi:hypothetical protein